MEHKRIRILSINVFQRPPFVHSSRHELKGKRLQHFSNDIIQEYDIILLQEMFMFCSRRQSQFLKAADLKGFHYSAKIPYSLKDLLQLKVDSGLMVVSKYKIISTEYIHYSYACSYDRFCAKGALTVLVEVEGKKIRLFTTHIQSSYRNDLVLSDKSVRVRSKQLRQLAAFIATYKMKEPTIPVVLMGDLNVDAVKNLEEYEQMIRIFEKNDIGRIENVLLKKYNKHQTTIGGIGDSLPINPKTGHRIKKEDFFSSKMSQECDACIDYIFWDSNGSTEFSIDYETSCIDPLCLNSDNSCTQVSDHYGVCLSLFLQ